jgi:TatD DNase family protein
VRYINFHSHNSTNDPEILNIQSITLAECSEIFHSSINYFSIGLHPWNRHSDKEYQELTSVSKNQNIIAIGECGLDKLQGPAISDQFAAFKFQALLAEKEEKPLIIHCVKAFNEIIELKKAIKPKTPWIIHGFRNNATLAKQLTDHGFTLSFCSQSLNNNSLIKAIPQVVTNNPFFLETDEFEPSSIKVLYEKFAEIINISQKQLHVLIESSFEKTFDQQMMGTFQ